MIVEIQKIYSINLLLIKKLTFQDTIFFMRLMP